jgi:threonine dehydratase
MAIFPVSADAIVRAHDLIRPYIHRTPVLTCTSLDHMAGFPLFFKCENFQKIGAFKIRGGMNAVLSLPEEDLAKGVTTHSSGNHAQALASAARMKGIPAYIVMPETSPTVKKQAVEGYGAKVTYCLPTQQAREETLAKVVAETGATFIHPYDHLDVIAGQATCAKELLEDVPGLDVVITPVGGGGLLAGTALYCHYFAPQVTVVAGEPTGADDTARSFAAHERVVPNPPHTIADGLLASVGAITFPVIHSLVASVITVTDQEIVAAMRLIWERMKIIIEPSCAVPFAALIQQKTRFAGKKVGVILTGGNVDLGKLPF